MFGELKSMVCTWIFYLQVVIVVWQLISAFKSYISLYYIKVLKIKLSGSILLIRSYLKKIPHIDLLKITDWFILI